MDDETYTTKFQVKGTAYRFVTFNPDQLFALTLLDSTDPRDVSNMIKLLRENTRPDDWHALWGRLTSREDGLTLEDLSKAFVRLYKESEKELTSKTDDA